MEWKEINEWLKDCLRIPDSQERIRCMQKLFEDTGDGWVAYHLGREYENVENLKKASHFYKIGVSKLPLPKYKNMAKEALEKIREKQNKVKPIFTEPLNIKEKEEVLVVISCSKTKIWDRDKKTPIYISAQEVYQGLHFIKWIKEKRKLKQPFRWIILSAKYGFIEPYHPISNYDVTFDNKETGPISTETLINQAYYQRRWKDGKKLADFNEIFFVGSNSYYHILCKVFKDKNIKKWRYNAKEKRVIKADKDRGVFNGSGKSLLKR